MRRWPGAGILRRLIVTRLSGLWHAKALYPPIAVICGARLTVSALGAHDLISRTCRVVFRRVVILTDVDGAIEPPDGHCYRPGGHARF